MKTTKSIRLKAISENLIKRQVKDYLDLRGYFHFYLLAGIGAFLGAPDIIAIKNNRVLFLEIKRPGGKQSEHQRKFQLNIEGQGGEYYIVEKLEDLIQIIL